MSSSRCPTNLSSGQCDIYIMEKALDKAKDEQGKRLLTNPHIQKIVDTLRNFVIEKKLIIYGGLAINNILPANAQFYKPNEFPDYDIFSPDAFNTARHLADAYHAAGFKHVEAKAGIHVGTFKVFVDFMAVADLTDITPSLYKTILKDSINIGGLHYAAPNFLRMSMYLELSRPSGDLSRWEKVMRRLKLLNIYYPMYADKHPIQHSIQNNKLFNDIKNHFIEERLVFFGPYVCNLYNHYYGTMPLRNIPDFNVFSLTPKITAELLSVKIDGVVQKHTPVDEIIPEHYTISVHDKIVATIYKPNACYSYNILQIEDQVMNIASIDTTIGFCLALSYSSRRYHDNKRYLYMAYSLMEILRKYPRENRGLLKRFPTICYGVQKTLQDIKRDKAEKYRILKKGTRKWKYLFMKYAPDGSRKGSRKRRT
jgi:hypothetical protein